MFGCVNHTVLTNFIYDIPENKSQDWPLFSSQKIFQTFI